MKTKRAFTLIELLVVIAIIAILAAILFPVFAQAKLQAKKSASLSNVKQITLAGIMYENDYDDDFVLSMQDYLDSQCGLSAASGTFTCYYNLPSATLMWDMLLVPYIKTLGLFVDPGTGDPNNYFGSSTASIVQNWNFFEQYGYNTYFLSPLPLSGLTGGGTLPSGYHIHISGVGRSATAAINPAGTPMFLGDQGFALTNSGSGLVVPSTAYPAGGDWGVGNVPAGVVGDLFAAPDRLVFVGQVAHKAQDWAQGFTASTSVGPTTGNTRAINPYGNAVTGFVDGHAKAMSAGALSVGTDGGNSTEVWSTPAGWVGAAYSCTCGSQVTNLNAYLWSLDGTLNDVN